MDHETNKQESSSTEGGEMKAGDKVWVLCEVVEPCENLITVTPGGPHNWFWAGRKQCRLVEPQVIKESLTTESNCPEIPDSSSDPINPPHYKHLPAEAIDIIFAAIAKAPSKQAAFLQGQVVKYLLRCWSKNGIEDLRKAKWYLDRLVSGFDDLLGEASEANDEVGE
jgi:hypothetical protein